MSLSSAPVPRSCCGFFPLSAMRTKEPEHVTVHAMTRRDPNPDFVEALARGLDVIRAFQPRQPAMSLAAVAAAAGLPRPSARRILLTLRQMGYGRAADGGFELTPRVLELGMAYILSRNRWDLARPHIERLVARTRESSSVAQL